MVRFLLASLPLVRADLPVHCLRHQIVGEWEFHLGEASDVRSSCGHQRPDSERAEPMMLRSLEGSSSEASKLNVQLSLPNMASTDRDSLGSFTMIYDEGFEVAVDGKVFFAFSRYDFDSEGRNQTHCDETLTGWYHDKEGGNYGCYYGIKKSSGSAHESAETMPTAASIESMMSSAEQHEQEAPVESPVAEESPVDSQSSDGDSDSSDHTEVSVDSKEDAAENFANFRNNFHLDTIESEPRVHHRVDTVSTIFDNNRKEESSKSDSEDTQEKEDSYEDKQRTAASTRMESRLSQIAAEYNSDMRLGEKFHREVVDNINTPSLLQEKTTKKTWKAKVYKSYINKTRAEINSMAGIKRSVTLAQAHANGHRHRPQQENPFLATEGRSFLQVKSTSEGKSKTKLPRSVDWAASGYVDPVINQGDCGSCFTVATVRMLSARNRIQNSNKELEPFSIAFPLHCGEYNQGCDGGYAFLQSKWSEDVGLIPARCFPYSTGSGPGACTSFAQDDSKSGEQCLGSGADMYRAHNHRYIGGYYGGSDEQDIMEELANNGPLVVSFEPKDDFMYYNSGIYNSGADQIHQEWERVDHAVLLVGYGEEAGHKFWKVQNSWGNEWGENGFFRITRGDNDSGIESISVAADVVPADGERVKQFIKGVRSF